MPYSCLPRICLENLIRICPIKKCCKNALRPSPQVQRKPLGRPDSEAVRAGNVLATRALILCLLAGAKAIWWVLEQPQSSCMHLLPCFQDVLRMVSVQRLRINMSNFGGPTRKGTYLYSSSLSDLQRYCFGFSHSPKKVSDIYRYPYVNI